VKMIVPAYRKERVAMEIILCTGFANVTDPGLAFIARIMHLLPPYKVVRLGNNYYTVQFVETIRLRNFHCTPDSSILCFTLRTDL
jgi:hypothetical protein